MEILLRKKLKKELKKITPKLQERFFERMELFLINPHNPILNNHSVDAAYPGMRSINITGDLRALYQPIENLYVFVRIGTHSELY